MIYGNKDYYLLRKPHGIASTFGQQLSVLDYFHDIEQFKLKIINNSDFDFCSSFCYLDGFMLDDDFSNFLLNQNNVFDKEQEFGLLNRLDNDTGGFLYFAKNPESFRIYKEQQKRGEIQKMYLAQVLGNPFLKTDSKIINIDTPIMHHRFDEQKMIVVATSDDQSKGRGNLHQVVTSIELIKYDEKNNQSLIRVMIHKGVRHQIRVHCKSIGAPILGDLIYGQKPPVSDFLNLWSIGMKMD